MQAQIVIDDELIHEASRLTGVKNENEIVEIALRELVEHRRNDALARAFGQMHWEGDLDAMRMDR